MYLITYLDRHHRYYAGVLVQTCFIYIYVCSGSSVDLEKVNVYWDMNCSLIIHNMLIIVGTCPLHF